jgi:RND superfamily putative drug exporter
MRERSVFEGLAAWSGRHRWWALAAWVLVLAAVTVAAQAAGAAYHNDFSLPGTDSQRALNALRADAPVRAGDTIQVVLAGELGDPAVRPRVDALVQSLRPLAGVTDVRGPYDTPGAISADGRIGYATVTLTGTAQDVPAADVRTIIDTAQRAHAADLTVELGGDAVRGAQESSGGAAEGLGLLVALIILVLMFGSLLAASLPLVIAVFAVATSIGVTALASHLATIADFTPSLMILVGLGVGIDYALLLFSRFRAELLHGSDPAHAVAVALDTAGRTVFFAGATVIIALLGLVVLGLGSLQGVAVAVAVTVLVTMAAALTLLPALLAITGGRIERRVRRAAERRARRSGRPEGDRWRRWTGLVQSRPWTATIVATAALLGLAAPALGINLGFADAGNDDRTSTSRRAYDLLASGFGPGVNGPLIVVVTGNAAAGESVRRALAATPGVASASGPFGSPGGAIATVVAVPASKPQARQTNDLVARLRADVLPPVARATGATVLVGGSTAAAVDFADAVAGRLPAFVAVVVGLSALLLMVVFRSLLIPLKAAALNLLSVGAALGVITLVFQHGLLGVEPGPIEAYVPVMIFAIAFGLSMDYEVFLLARMHEEWTGGRDAAVAVREGIATTGRVVTAAAAIMVVVFGAFLLDPSRMLQQFGLGLAAAVLLDALVIRCLILPAVMHLLGARAWWLPGWLARPLPRVALERPSAGPAREAVPS